MIITTKKSKTIKSLKGVSTKNAWLHITAPTNVAEIQKKFNLHPLVTEDILTKQRPKIDDYEKYLFVTVNYLELNAELSSQQISMVMGKNYVLSFQSGKKDLFEGLRVRIEKGASAGKGMDYVGYLILDTVVDHYFSILEELGERIEKLETALLKNPDETLLQQIHKVRKQMMFIRRTVWPLREVINGLARGEDQIIKSSTHPQLRDLYNNVVQLIDTEENYRDMITGMLDVYLSSISNRMNEIMKVLTIIATIFIPLTFITGVYGMNFKHMPELETLWGYPLVWVVMITLGVMMLLFFRKKRWL